jgi:hypothetical protein
MGPILAGTLHQLYQTLLSSNSSMVFFCSRGGLVIRRALELFARRTNVEIPFQHADFMISRLSAFRSAFHVAPLKTEALIDSEFTGRTCGQVIRALWGVELKSPDKDLPFNFNRMLQISRTGSLGKQIRERNSEQSTLLRDYIEELRAGHRRITICDTGVYGSILQYLRLGLPVMDWQSVLLYRANYKRIKQSHFDVTVGAVSESNIYLPWRSNTAVLLYWPFFEAFLEPPLPSVTEYRRTAKGNVVSDLEIEAWESVVNEPQSTILIGAWKYLESLSSTSLLSVHSMAEQSWKILHRMIIYPRKQDLLLLQVGPRELNFGTDEKVFFTSTDFGENGFSNNKASRPSLSIWPEGELRRQYPRSAGLLLTMSELLRWPKALTYSVMKQSTRHAVRRR